MPRRLLWRTPRCAGELRYNDVATAANGELPARTPAGSTPPPPSPAHAARRRACWPCPLQQHGPCAACRLPARGGGQRGGRAFCGRRPTGHVCAPASGGWLLRAPGGDPIPRGPHLLCGLTQVSSTGPRRRCCHVRGAAPRRAGHGQPAGSGRVSPLQRAACRSCRGAVLAPAALAGPTWESVCWLGQRRSSLMSAGACQTARQSCSCKVRPAAPCPAHATLLPACARVLRPRHTAACQPAPTRCAPLLQTAGRGWRAASLSAS